MTESWISTVSSFVWNLEFRHYFAKFHYSAKPHYFAALPGFLRNLRRHHSILQYDRILKNDGILNFKDILFFQDMLLFLWNLELWHYFAFILREILQAGISSRHRPARIIILQREPWFISISMYLYKVLRKCICSCKLPVFRI